MLLKRAPATVATVYGKKQNKNRSPSVQLLKLWCDLIREKQRKTRKTHTKQKPEDHPNDSSFQALLTKINNFNSFREKLPGK